GCQALEGKCHDRLLSFEALPGVIANSAVSLWLRRQVQLRLDGCHLCSVCIGSIVENVVSDRTIERFVQSCERIIRLGPVQKLRQELPVAPGSLLDKAHQTGPSLARRSRRLRAG